MISGQPDSSKKGQLMTLVMPAETKHDGTLIPDRDAVSVLDTVRAALTDYVVMPSPAAAHAVTLWIVVTHAIAAFDTAPRLAIASPLKRCGKTRLLDVITGLVHEPLVAVSATTPAIYRSLGGEQPPTLVIDEADTIWGTKRGADGNEDLRALLNAGFQRGKPVLRCVGPESRPTAFATFAAAALAGIGRLPDTITDRAINITMRRRTAYEAVLPFRIRRDTPRLEQIRHQLADWANERITQLQQHVPDMPLEDREADTWEPLITIADHAGGRWPARARSAAATLTMQANRDDEHDNVDQRLLTDLHNILAHDGRPFVPTSQLLAALHAVDDAPWGELRLTARALADRLRPFEITPVSSGTVRGYRTADFADTFARYLRARGGAVTTVKASKPQLNPLTVSEGLTDKPSEPDRAPPQPAAQHHSTKSSD